MKSEKQVAWGLIKYLTQKRLFLADHLADSFAYTLEIIACYL